MDSSEPQAAATTRDYPERMGSDLGRVYAALFEDLAWLHLRWNLYRQVYIDPTPPLGRIDEQMKLLAGTAPSFSRALQRILWYDVLVGLASITDSESSGRGRDNLSLRRLLSVIDDQAFKVQAQQLVGSAEQACADIRDWRNRRIAHRDLGVALHARRKESVQVHRT